MDYYTKKGKKYCAHFPTTQEFIDQATVKRANVLNGFKPWGNASHSSDKDFTGTYLMEDAENLFIHGWDEGKEKLMQINANVNEQGNKIFSERYDVAGHYPSAQRYAAGMPDCMINRGSTQGNKKVLRVVFSIGASWRVKTHQIENYGAALLSIVDTLENKGYSLEIIIAMKAEKHGKSFLQTVTAKEAGEPLDMERLAFMLVHPSMLRRFAFGIIEANNDLKFLTDSYGKPVNPTQKDFDQDVIMFPSITTNYHEANTPQAARKFLIEQTNKLLGYDALERD